MIDARDFEGRYRQHEEPWAFSERAAELLRHQWVVETTRRFAPARVLDVGCSLGQLASALATLPTELHAIDVSPTAVTRARARVAAGAAPTDATVRFLAGSATTLPLATRSFDFVLACDGLYSWELDDDERKNAIAELHRVLRVGGHALLTEHVRPSRFDEFVTEIAASRLRIVSVMYLYDRPWYRFESWVKAMRDWGVVKRVLRSVSFARFLQRFGRVMGRNASRHICVLATRDP